MLGKRNLGNAEFTILFRKSSFLQEVERRLTTSLAIRLQLLSCWSYNNIDVDKHYLSLLHPETTRQHTWLSPKKKKKNAVNSEASLKKKRGKAQRFLTSEWETIRAK